MNTNVIYANFPQHPRVPHVMVGQMVQLFGWPEDHWAEAFAVSYARRTVSLVRYSECGTKRYREDVPATLIGQVIEKRDIPVDHLTYGSIDLAQGKLGQVSMRWSNSGAMPRVFA